MILATLLWVPLTVAQGDDCNNNTIPDVDEIAADPTLDCNNDGLLDECSSPVMDPVVRSITPRVGAPAAAVVAANFAWTPGAVRVVVPISDEGPCRGNACSDPGSDRDSIDNAIAVANAQVPPVIVSPIAGTSSNACVTTLGGDLAAGTRGTAFVSSDPNLDLAQAISGSRHRRMYRGNRLQPELDSRRM